VLSQAANMTGVLSMLEIEPKVAAGPNRPVGMHLASSLWSLAHVHS